MAPLSNLAVRDIETVAHPYTNLAALRETGPLIIEREAGANRMQDIAYAIETLKKAAM